MDKLLDPLREDKSSYTLTRETTIFLNEVIKAKFKEENVSIWGVIDLVKKVQKKLALVHPLEFSIRNIIKKVILIIKDQARSLNLPYEEKKVDEEDKFIKRMTSSVLASNTLITSTINASSFMNNSAIPLNSQTSKSFEEDLKGIRMVDDSKTDSNQMDLGTRELLQNNISNAIEDLIHECENLSQSINVYAHNHIFSNEIVATFGHSTTVFNFLVEASKKRNFEVIVMEDTLTKGGAKMAKKLADNNINTLLIPDTAIFSVMPRINKAFIGAHAIMANGGILNSSGALLLGLAAKSYQVPLIVIAGIFKLTPNFPFEQETYNEIINPGTVFNKKESAAYENIDILIPRLDYLAPEYIQLYITNLGEHTPSYLYRVFSEYYLRE